MKGKGYFPMNEMAVGRLAKVNDQTARCRD